MPVATLLGLLNLVAIGILGLVVRHYLSSYFIEKGKNLATKEDIADITARMEEVRTQYATQLERVRFELAHTGNIQRFQYETEFKTYQEIWEALVLVQSAVQALRPMIDTHLPDKAEREKRDQDRVNVFGKAFNDFSRIVYKSRPFFPKEIFTQIEALLKLVHGEALEVVYKEDGWNKEYWQSARKNAEAISSQVDAICEVMRARLHHDSNRTIGVRPPTVA
jgi:hypothetical protein